MKKITKSQRIKQKDEKNQNSNDNKSNEMSVDASLPDVDQCII